MESLLRVKSGQFVLENSMKLSEIVQQMEAGTLEEKLIHPDELFKAYPAMKTKKEGEKLLYNGNPMPETLLDGEDAAQENGSMVRIYDSQGEFIGLYIYQAERRWYKPKTLFLG